MHTLIIGAGYSGAHIARHAQRLGTVCGTRTQLSSLDELSAAGIQGIQLSAPESLDDVSAIAAALTPALQEQLLQTTHLVSCVGPDRQAPLNDSVLRLLASSVQLPLLRWVGYLSTIGVYGNHDGNWVDEDSPCTSKQTRSIMRREAELGWQQQAASWQVPISILRLSGIYGPGRNAVVDALAGRARMLIKPDQVFNRIHVEDLAAATMLCAKSAFNGVVNITDDLPAPPQDIIRFAHQLVGRPEPVALDFSTADISPMARSFYSENKRVRNTLSKQALGMSYRFPTYKHGLDALFRQR
ncbi:MAG: SDR family oxidoreductase [Granulosicoccus sp.]